MGTEANLMDDLAAAWDESDGTTENIAEETISAPIEDSTDDIPPVEDAPTGADDAPAGDEPLAAEPEKAPAEEAPVAEDAAPMSLPPEAREVWKDTPPAVKAAVAKREADYAAGIQRYAENAKRAEAMDHTLAPYQQYLQMNGGPGQAIKGLLQTGAILQSGSPAQKAQAAAQIISQFGVDINTLDSMLAGETQQPAAQPQQQQFSPQDIQRMVDQRMYEQQRQVASQGAETDIQMFASDPANEFYGDVRGLMADIFDVAAANNQSISMKEAYDRACVMHPGVSQAIEMRKQSQDIGRKQAAAASVSGRPSGNRAAGSSTLHGAIEDAWDNVGRM